MLSERRGPWPAEATALVVSGVASLVLFAGLAVDVSDNRSIVVDPWTMDVLDHGLVRTRLVHLLGVLGNAGGLTGTVVISACVLVALLAARRLRAAAFFAVAVGVVVFNPLLKDLFDRPARTAPWRPPVQGFFPSGHAAGSMAVWSAIVALAWNTPRRRVAVAVAICAVLLVGLSAIYNGGHWPSDVLGGWALAFGWVAIVSGVVLAVRRTEAPDE